MQNKKKTIRRERSLPTWATSGVRRGSEWPRLSHRVGVWCLVLFAGVFAISPVANAQPEPYGWFWLDYRGPNNQAPNKTPNNWVPEFGGDFINGVGEPAIGGGLTAQPVADGRPSNPPYVPDDIFALAASSVTATSAAEAIMNGDFMVIDFTTSPGAPSKMVLTEFRKLNVSQNYFGTQFTAHTMQVEIATVNDFSVVLASDTMTITPLATADSSDWVYFSGLEGTVLENDTTYYLRMAFFNSGSSAGNVRIIADDFIGVVVVPEPSTTLLVGAALFAGLVRRRRRALRSVPR